MRLTSATGAAVLLAAAVLVVAGTVHARTAGEPWEPPRLIDYQWYQKNQWRLPITNYATFGYGIGRSGGEWPAGSGDMYIYGAGIWIGSIRYTASGQDTLVSNGYNPNSGSSEMTPGCYDNAPGGYSGRDEERVYIAPDDWPPVASDFPSSLHDSILTPLRIPPPDTTGDTVVGWYYYVPRSAVSTGDAWTVFNDADPERHTAGRSERPMGIEVYQTTYSWTLPWNRDIVFFKLDVRNRNDDTLRDVYLGMVCDADVGSATDDLCGLVLNNDTVNYPPKFIPNAAGTDSAFADNLGYVYSNEPVPQGFVGFDFLQSPYVVNPDGSVDGIDGLDNNANGLIDEPAEGAQLGMTSFKIFILGDGDPSDDFQQYLALAGYYWEPPYEYVPYDSVDPTPDDKRFLQSTGPFDLAPDEMVTVTIGLIAADCDREDPPESWPYNLAVASRAAQAAYDNNWIMPEPPPSPNVTVMPGDGAMTIVWDDMPENARDRFFAVAPTLNNPYYAEQDFQGYKLYRSRTGQPNDWELLEQFDRADGIVYEDTVEVESLRTVAADAGLAYSYVDSSDLRLGFPYYYAVTSFDINYLGGDTVQPVLPDTLTLESGMTSIRGVPRTQPGNYAAPEYFWQQVAGNDAIRMALEPFAVTPHAVKDEVYRLQFLAPGYDPDNRRPVYRYLVTGQAGDTVVGLGELPVQIDSVTDTVAFVPTVFDSVITLIVEDTSSSGEVTIDTTKGWLPVVQVTGKLKMDQIPLQFLDRVEVVSGDYPQDSLNVPTLTDNRALWAYRGSDFRLVWKTHEASGNITCDVYDVDNQLEVAYRPIMRTGQPADSADGWCFQTLTDAADTLSVGNTYYMQICGGRFTFRRGPLAELPEPGDTWLVRSGNLTPAPSFAAYEVEFRAMQFEEEVEELDVKVVPNPYLVRNEWERHPDFRKLKFINLPDHCTIRIFNLAGDLVRTLIHDKTNPTVGGLPNQYGGDEDWDLLNESQQKPAPGVYLFHVESDVGTQVGKFVIIY